MKLKLAILFTTILFISSCKDNNSNNNSNTNEKVDKENNIFKISFDLIVKKNDNMHLYYTQDGTIDFDEKNSVWMPVNGSEKTQTILFKLPEDVLPTAIRVDFGYGKNPEQSDVELKTFKMSYFGKTVEANGVSILDYFYPNKENTEVIPGTSTLKRIKKDQESGPILYPQIPLSEKIKELTLGIK